MITRALGPTVSELPSRKTRCARSRAAVVTSSLACTSMPMRRMRSFASGGLPKGSPSEAVVTRHGEHDAEDGVVLKTQDARIDDDIGLVVGPPLLGRRKIDRPGQPGAQHRIGE